MPVLWNQGIFVRFSDENTLISNSTPEKCHFGIVVLDGFICGVYVYLCFFDALDRAHRHALRGIKVPYALHTGVGIDHIDGAAFADRASRAFRFAGAAWNARIVNFHRHEKLSWCKNLDTSYGLRLLYRQAGVKWQRSYFFTGFVIYDLIAPILFWSPFFI